MNELEAHSLGTEGIEEIPDLSESDQEIWLISYADLMTLLFSLFAMMFSFASFDEQLARNVESALSRNFGDPQAIRAPQDLSANLKNAISQAPFLNAMDLKIQENGVEIKFGDAALFGSGEAELLPEAMKGVSTMIEIIRKASRGTRVRVEGHTDDNPISTSRYPSNWELSAARAATIIRLFEAAGFPSESLEAIGYGATRPLLPNRQADGEPIAENQKKNRRVLIKVIFQGQEIMPADGAGG